MIPKIQIAMLGARGVGKTSLLTAMYDQFENTVGKTNLQLIPIGKSNAKLQEKLAQLRSLLDDFEATGGLQGDSEINSFLFELGQKGAKPFLQLEFKDFKGGYLNSEALESHQNLVQSLINESAVILIAIDTPALMEVKGRYHPKINIPLQTKNILSKAFQGLKSPRLVILAPIKCEKYVQDEKSCRELLNRLRDGYTELLDFLSSETVARWVVTVVTPVQTVGTVVFSHIEFIEEDGQKNPHFKFHKINHDAEYSPKDSEQPFRYILRFLIKCELDRRNGPGGLFEFLRSWLKLDQEIIAAEKNVAKGCKEDAKEGFAILQGEKFFAR